jgi:hypothetical protein
MPLVAPLPAASVANALKPELAERVHAHRDVGSHAIAGP